MEDSTTLMVLLKDNTIATFWIAFAAVMEQGRATRELETCKDPDLNTSLKEAGSTPGRPRSGGVLRLRSGEALRCRRSEQTAITQYGIPAQFMTTTLKTLEQISIALFGALREGWRRLAAAEEECGATIGSKKNWRGRAAKGTKKVMRKVVRKAKKLAMPEHKTLAKIPIVLFRASQQG